MRGRTARRGAARASAGFSLVELLVASAAAVVLALTAGMLLFLLNSILVRTAGHQEIQRDATFAMDLLSRTVQSSRGRELTVAAGRIEFATNHVRAGRVLFYNDSQGNLVYDPNMEVAGNEIRVVNRRLAAFSGSITSNRMWIALGLRDGAKSLYLTNCLVFRNGT